MTRNQPDFSTPSSRSGRDFSYARSFDSPLRSWVIRTVERLSGKKGLLRHYHAIYEEGLPPWAIWGQALEKLNIRVDFDAGQVAKIPTDGPVIVVANHPFGVVDGLILCHIVTRVRRDLFLLVNEVLAHEPILEGHLLPVDFRKSKEALVTNLRTKEQTVERLRRGEVLAIFPSGAVATSMRPFGPVEELPWRRFISNPIHRARCTVVPMFFRGQNSRLFQVVSQVSMDLRLGLLLHEVRNKQGRRIRVEVGDPIRYEAMEPYRDRQQLIDFLRVRTLALGGGQPG